MIWIIAFAGKVKHYVNFIFDLFHVNKLLLKNTYSLTTQPYRFHLVKLGTRK